VAALPGLVVETWLLLPLAVGWLLLSPNAASTQASFWTSSEALWLVAAGPITLVPLVCFNAAARHLPYTTLGFLQYLAPTLVMLQAIFLFDEHFDPSKLLAFCFIWAGLAIYSVDAWLTLRRNA
jgi:chloramphenicol-sensitive protein RarD